MELPDFTPESMRHLASADNDTELFTILVSKPSSVIPFFLIAVEDETWTDKHSAFIQQTIGWMTHQFFLGQIAIGEAKKIADAIHSHLTILEPHLYRDLEVMVDNQKIAANSLLLSAASRYFQDLIRKDCRGKNTHTLLLPHVNKEDALEILGYCEKNEIPNLWRWEKDKLLSFLPIVIDFELIYLSKECQELLCRYITQENVIENLLFAFQQKWFVLKRACEEYFNHLDRGINFHQLRDEDLAVELLNFNEATLSVANTLAPFLTHLIMNDRLTLDPQFDEIMQKCPNLLGLDVSGSVEMSDFLLNIPRYVQELSLSKCEWLNLPNFKNILMNTPQLTKIDLSLNPQLNYVCFGELRRLQQLKVLNLSHCHQISDQDISLIAQASIYITDLFITDCKKMSENGFITWIRTLPRLSHLTSCDTYITDSVLIELGTRCRYLHFLDLTHCTRISDRGISELLRLSNTIHTLILTDCKFSKDTVSRWRAKYPLVNIQDFSEE